MSMSLNHQSMMCPLFGIDQSPYLSPLIGSASNLPQSSQDQLNDFHLEDEPIFQIGGDLDEHSLLGSFSEFLFQAPECDLYTTTPLEQPVATKEEVPTPCVFPSSSNKSRTQYLQSQLSEIISFISSNDHLTESELLAFGKPLYQNSEQMEFVFLTLLAKFSKLRKTKEEMIKYCMRKAFKFIGDKTKEKEKREKGDKKGSTDPAFSMPFRKNSAEKTMNFQYLKQIFSNTEFSNNYRDFLTEIQKIIEEDNNSKIQYLSDTIERLLLTNSRSDIEKIKRLPWNRSILKKTSDLAKNLIDMATSSDALGKVDQNSEQQS